MVGKIGCMLRMVGETSVIKDSKKNRIRVKRIVDKLNRLRRLC